MRLLGQLPAVDSDALGPKLAATDWSNCHHWYIYRAGTRRGKQRHRCCFCGARFTEGRAAIGIGASMLLIPVLAPFFKRGASANSTATATGTTIKTVSKYYRKYFLPRRPCQLCACGKPILHVGACTNVDRSAARKAPSFSELRRLRGLGVPVKEIAALSGCARSTISNAFRRGLIQAA